MSNVNVSKDIEFAVVTTLSSIFNDVAYIDNDILSNNLAFMCDTTVPSCYKSVPTKMLDYIIDNMGYLYFALLVESKCRESIKNHYIPMMYKFDKLTDKQLLNRSVVDFASYNHTVYMSVLKRITNSMSVLDDYKDLIDMFVGQLTMEDMIDIGYIVSNFGYCIKALSVDKHFAELISDMIWLAKPKLESMNFNLTMNTTMY